MFPTDPLKTSAALSETVLRPLAADASTSATAPTTPTVRTTPSLLRLQRRTSTPIFQRVAVWPPFFWGPLVFSRRSRSGMLERELGRRIDRKRLHIGFS